MGQLGQPRRPALRIAMWMGLLLAGIAAVPGRALTPYLVKHINPTVTPASSSPGDFTALGDFGLFIANDGTGNALWRSDGTEAGTSPLLALGCRGCGVRYVAVTDTLCFFLSFPAQLVAELWVTGGTRETTVSLGGFAPGAAANSLWVPEQGLLYFDAYEGGQQGTQLWRTDGSAAGTFRVTDLAPGTYGSFPRELTDFGGQLFFTADNGRGNALWTTDGTPGGTRLVKNFWPGNPNGKGPAGDGPRFLTALAGRLVFVASSPDRGSELWRSDGTPDGTVPLRELVPGPASPTFFSFRKIRGRRLLFMADEGSGPNVWVTNGTDRGTRRLTSLSAAGELGPGFLFHGPVVDGRVFFSADDGVHGAELWTSDGTEAGTYQVSDVCPGPCSSHPVPHLAAGGQVFFAADDGRHGRELWSTDGTAGGTAMVKDVCLGGCGSDPLPLAVIGGSQVLFQADDWRNGLQLWRTDGTAAGTQRLTGLPGTRRGITNFRGAALADLMLFAATDPDHGTELWATNGRRWGTGLVKDIATADLGGSFPAGLQAAGNKLFFFADDGAHGNQLWTSDGTEGGTVPASDFGPGGVAIQVPLGAAAVGGTLFFFGAARPDDPALWKSDGTPAGTVRLTPPTVRPAPSSELVAVGSTVFFQALGARGRALWRSDGTVAGTAPVDPVRWSGGDAQKLTAFQGQLFYFLPGGDGNLRLWRTDGTPQGTIRVANLKTSFDSGIPPLLTEFAGRLYFFVLEDRTRGIDLRLWSTDGTAAGTGHAASFAFGPDVAFFPDRLAVAGGRLFIFGSTFRASGGSFVPALWVSDGTEAGTRLVRQRIAITRHRPSSGGGPADSVDYNGRLVFVGADSIDGPSGLLWASDGTAAGTVPLLDAAGRQITSARNPRVFAGFLVFAAPLPGPVNSGYIVEVWQSDGTSAGTTPIFPLGPIGQSFGEDLVVAGPHLFMNAYDPAVGDQLFALRPD